MDRQATPAKSVESDPTRTLDAAVTRGAARPSMSGGELEDFLHLQEAGLINNPQGASLTLGADLRGLQLPCVTLLPTSPASLKSRTIGSLAQALTALLRAPRLMATGAMAIFMPCRQRFERARDRRSTFSSDILARHCQATKNSRRLSLLAGLRPLHQFGTYPPAPMSHFPENYSRTLEYIRWTPKTEYGDAITDLPRQLGDVDG
jgi:hypothetical protein